jgi:hypothetical protein
MQNALLQMAALAADQGEYYKCLDFVVKARQFQSRIDANISTLLLKYCKAPVSTENRRKYFGIAAEVL